ncbi:MAG: helix-turn-helix transcriptional regulator [Pseudomonadota bacterium]
MNSVQDIALGQTEVRDRFSEHVKSLGYGGFDAFSMRFGSADDPRTDANFYISDFGFDPIFAYLTDKFFQSDPVLAHIGQTVAPFDYVEFIKTCPANASIRFQRMMTKLNNVHRAWCIPLNTIGNTRAVTVYMRGNSKKSREIFDNTIGDLHLEAVKVMDELVLTNREKTSVARSDSNPVAPANGAQFSEKERRCLYWIARGKTNWEVGQILGISENTVRYHLKSAFSKLNVKSRAQAASAALQIGLIEI